MDDNSQTALWLAIENNQKDSVEVLLSDDRTNINCVYRGNTPLEYAIEEAQSDMCKLLIEKGANIHVTDETGKTPLHHVTRRGMLDIVEALINKGANINARTNKGYTSLHFASSYGKLGIVEFLIEKGADINVRSTDVYEFTPLQLAVRNAKLEVAELLICKGADVNAVDIEAHFTCNRNAGSFGGTLLHWAARFCDSKVIRFLIQNGANVNAAQNDGRTALCLLVKHMGSLDTIQYLIENGADLNNSRGGTPLYWAFYSRYSNAADLLIELGTDVNSYIDSFGDMTAPLHLVRKLSTAKLLIEKGANVNTVDKHGNAPLHYVSNLLIGKLLLEKGANINAVNNDGYMPLHYAKNLALAKLFIKKGADINATNHEGYTPLHLAVNVSIADILINNGADFQAVTENGKTVLHTAAEADTIYDSRFRNVPNLVDFYVQKGIDVNVTDNYGNTPLDSSKKGANIDVAKRLLENGANMNALNNCNDNDPDRQYGIVTSMLESLNKLFTAVKNDEDLGEIKRLVATSRVINCVQDGSKLTILHHAVQKCNKKIVQFLLQEKKYLCKKTSKNIRNCVLGNIDVNARSIDNWTPLHFAIQRNDEDIVRMLLESGAAYNVKTILGNTPLELTENMVIKYIFVLIEKLFEAVKAGNREEVVKCLEEERVIINTTDSLGNSPLHYAVKGGYHDIVIFLLESGAFASLRNNIGSTIIHFAASKDDETMVNILLRHVKEPNALNNFINAKTMDDTTALHIAAMNGSLGVVKCLLKCGAIYNIKNMEGTRAVDLSKNEDVTNFLKLTEELFEDAENGNPEIIDRLQNMEPNEFITVIHACDSEGNTLTDVMNVNENASILEKFLELKSLRQKKLLLKNPSSGAQDASLSDEDVDLGFGLFN